MKRLSDKYVAGILDGEGCIGIKKVKSRESQSQCYAPYVKVVMTDYIIPELLQHSFGGNTWERKRTDGWKSSKEWVITGKSRVGHFLSIMQKHLIVKKPQCKIVREFCTHKTSSHLTDDVVAERERLYNEIRKLNSRIKSPAETK